MVRIDQIKFGPVKVTDEMIKSYILKKYNIKEADILSIKISKESVDARNKSKISRVFSVDLEVRNEKNVLKRNKNLISNAEESYMVPDFGTEKMEDPPVIIGFGPAGMFAGLILSQMGYNPLIFERGEDVSNRTETIEKFWNEGILDEESNVQFGEGGAGTFSDGKLTTRIKDIRCKKVFSEFVNAGAPEEILYRSKPHIGTDILKEVVVNIRNKIIENGGTVKFKSKVEKLIFTDSKISGVELADSSIYNSQNVILAIGHSARDTFQMLNDMNIKIFPKPFAIGVRVEHPQEIIDLSQYGDRNMREILGAADYALTHKSNSGRGVYTFCMCPGGYVVAASSEKETVVTNGMSEYSRDGENANSAILVSVTPEDYGDRGPLSGMFFQRDIEKKAYEAAGRSYKAPAQRIGDFLGKSSNVYQDKDISPTYKPGVEFIGFEEIFPSYIIEGIREGIIHYGKRIKGFDMDKAILTGVESRSSSPIRIVRDELSLESVTLGGLYPCGEGAGYAGGIVSSAVDGIKIAEKIIEKYRPIGKE